MCIVIKMILYTASATYRKNMVRRGTVDCIVQYQKLLALNRGRMQSMCNLVFIRQVLVVSEKAKRHISNSLFRSGGCLCTLSTYLNKERVP